MTKAQDSETSTAAAMAYVPTPHAAILDKRDAVFESRGQDAAPDDATTGHVSSFKVPRDRSC